MATAPPVYFDPGQIQLSMPYAMPYPPPPLAAPLNHPNPETSAKTRSNLIDILKVLVGLLIVLILGAILGALIFLPRKSDGIDLSEPNEKMIKLLVDSNEKIARLQREQMLSIENERQKREENLLERHRAQDRIVAQQNFERKVEIENQRIDNQFNITELHREEDREIEQRRLEQQLGIAVEQMRQQLELEERRLEILAAEKQLSEEHRKEDFSKENTDILSNFMQEIILAKAPLSKESLELKTQSLILRFDSYHKSLLIKFLYKHKYLYAKDPNHEALDLQEANLKDLDLSNTGGENGQVGRSANYSQLSLSLTNLINASFQQILLNEADFSWCNMTGASFRFSKAADANFYRSILSFTNFQYTQIYRSNFSRTKIRRSSFISAELSESSMDNSDLGWSNFQHVAAARTNFSQSELTSVDFSYSNLDQAQLADVSAREANFYRTRAHEANFSGSYFSDCTFTWAELKNSSFRRAFVGGSNFENADVQDVDFTRAILAGAKITQGQLAVALSIANAVLPDGSIGKNINLAKNGNLHCIETINAIEFWNYSGNISIKREHNSTECAMQAKTVNATITQNIVLSRYKRMIVQGDSQIYFEMQATLPKYVKTSSPAASMNIRFMDSSNSQIGHEQSLLNQASFRPPSTYTASIPCPSDAVELRLTILFHEIETIVDNIYVTIE